MGIVIKPHPVKLITGIIIQSGSLLNDAEKVLARVFGSIDYRSRILDFDYTDYYTKTMGTGLKRVFLSFSRLIDPSKIAAIKVTTNAMEKRFLKGSRGIERLINIDPGYITEAKLVLASTKDYSHRIYLSKGIYAETTLWYMKNTFKPCSWTYPDYATDDYIDIFNEIRGIFMKQRKV
jgi:hypothetical protein